MDPTKILVTENAENSEEEHIVSLLRDLRAILLQGEHPPSFFYLEGVGLYLRTEIKDESQGNGQAVH